MFSLDEQLDCPVLVIRSHVTQGKNTNIHKSTKRRKMFDHCRYSLHFFHSEISAFVLAFVHASVLTSVVREIMHWCSFQMAIEKLLQK